MKRKIEKYGEFFQQPHEKSFELLEGYGRVIVSAPHSVEQTREGKTKFAEPQTGILARLLHDELNCPVIYKTKNCNDDANFDGISPYKDALSAYIQKADVRFLIDLHQLSSAREVSVNFGTANFRNIENSDLFNIVLGEFAIQNLGLIQIDVPFDASNPYTVSSYVHNKNKIPCIQIEINSKLLYGKLANEYFEKTYFALRNSVEKLNDYLEKHYEK